VLPESPSTNAYVTRRALDGEPPGLVVVAEHQTSGRGRLDRTWVTPPRAALTLSLLVAPDAVPVARWPWLPLLSGLAVVDGVRRAAGVEATLKWPNDVLVDGLKVAGILVERVERRAGAGAGAGAGPVAVVGIGLNVSSTREELPVDSATSLALAGATSLDRTELLRAVLTAFTHRFETWQQGAGRGLRAPYAEACSTLGRRVRVELPTGGSLTGQAVGVDDDGRLQVDDGTAVRVLGAGDVVHVRPG
jgi:BirA family biotin operon repressor/biotin-[acetyl-CoA-carboxylase] ligase